MKDVPMSILTEHDIISLSSFRESYKKYITLVQEDGHTLVLTQNGKASAIVLSPAEYDILKYQQETLSLIAPRLQEISEDTFVDDTEAMWKEINCFSSF